MDNNELITSLVALGGVPLILGLVQLFKPFISDTRYYSLMALAFGLIINFIAGVVLGAGWVASLFNGITAGLAAAFCGMVIENQLLIAFGSTVAASGSILTHVMCKAMNRSLSGNIIYSTVLKWLG